MPLKTLATTVPEALARATVLARRGMFEVEPNPMVGAVVLAGERVVGEGWHRAWGSAHAEVEALATAGAAARGATLCVTLEPCSTAGKTPPCTDAIIAAGVARVVVGSLDPNPAHHGRGLERLLAAGVEVDLLELPGPGELLRRFPAQLASRRPHVLAKWAMSKDGAIAPARGGRVAVSCDESQRLAHGWRAHVDALLVGVNTVIVDDPLLTARGDGPPRRTLRRVVLDPSLRTPLGARVVNTPDQAPTWILAADDAPPAAEAALSARGARVLRVPRGPEWLASGLERLAAEGCGRVLVEGGSHTLAASLAADVVDQAAIFMAPHSLGEGALPAVRGYRLGRLSPHEVATALGLSECRVIASGADTLLRGFRH